MQICNMSKLKRLISMAVSMAMLTICMGTSLAHADNIAKAENWFNRLTTYQANFTQTSSDGSHATGTFYLRRPHLSRFEYDDPLPLTLITSKLWLHVDEEDRREVTSYPVSETPLALILGDPVQLRGTDFTTTTSSKDGILAVVIEKDDGEAAGKVMLEFTENPFELRRWIITDANGITTAVFLTDPKQGHVLARKLFVPSDYPDTTSNN